MAGPRAEKVAVVEEVRGQLEQADAAILTEYRGLKVADLAALRRALRGAGTEYKIYKNTLVRRATADTPHAALETLLEGPTAIAFVDKDVAAAAKILREFAKTHPALVVKGSFVGSGLLDARTTNALADLPTRDVLLAQIAGALAAPMRQFAGLLKALPQGLAYGISALIDQRVAAGEALPPAGDDTSAPAAEAPAEPEVAVEPEATAAAEPEAVTEAGPEPVAEPEAVDVSAEAEAAASEGAAVSPPEPAEASASTDAEPAEASASTDAESTEVTE